MIVASMSTIPERKGHFISLVRRILDEQTVPVIRLHVCLHRYKTLDTDLPTDPRIVYSFSRPDEGPWVRYAVADRLADDDILATLDDDTIYPRDYVEKGVADLKRKGENAVVCYGGLRWNPLVERYDYYGAERTIILGETKLDKDFRVSILQGICSFMRARDAKHVIDLKLPGFNTNDDLMVSLYLQKAGRVVYCCAKSGEWVQQTADSTASHALAIRDRSVRRQTFHQMVYELGFDPSAGWLDEFLQKRERILLVAPHWPPINGKSVFIDKALASYKDAGSVHVLAPVHQSSLIEVQQLSDLPYVFHPIASPDEGGRLDNNVLVRRWRMNRIRNMTRRNWLTRRKAIEAKLKPTKVVELWRQTD